MKGERIRSMRDSRLLSRKTTSSPRAKRERVRIGKRSAMKRSGSWARKRYVQIKRVEEKRGIENELICLKSVLTY